MKHSFTTLVPSVYFLISLTPAISQAQKPSPPQANPLKPEYLQMAKAFKDKKPEQLFALWTQDYTENGAWGEEKEETILKRAAAEKDIKGEFPGNDSQIPGPSEQYYIRSLSSASGTLTADLLCYRVIPNDPSGKMEGNSDGTLHIVDTWVHSSAAQWKLRSRRVIPTIKPGMSQEQKDQAAQKLEDEFEKAQSEGKVIGADLYAEKDASVKAPSNELVQQPAASEVKAFVTISNKDVELSNSFATGNVAEAREQEGKEIACDGVVEAVHWNADKSAVILDFAKKDKPALYAFILKSHLAGFPKLESLLGKRVLIKGTMLVVSGQPKVEVATPQQIKIITSLP